MLELQSNDLRALAMKKVDHSYRYWAYLIFVELGLIALIPFTILLAYIDLPVWGTLSLAIVLVGLLAFHLRLLKRLGKAYKKETADLLDNVESGIAYNS